MCNLGDARSSEDGLPEPPDPTPSVCTRGSDRGGKLAGATGLEPAASCVSQAGAPALTWLRVTSISAHPATLHATFSILKQNVSGIGSVSSGLTFPYISLLIGPLSALERKIVEKLRFASMPVAASHVDSI